MYNRYVRNDDGVYRRLSVPDPPSDHTQPHPQRPPPPPGDSAPPPTSHSCDTSPIGGILGRNGLLSGVLEKLNLSEIDTGDLLLLMILFLLFREDGDDELLIALGLLLIL